jgi:hypothetical protein
MWAMCINVCLDLDVLGTTEYVCNRLSTDITQSVTRATGTDCAIGFQKQTHINAAAIGHVGA